MELYRKQREEDATSPPSSFWGRMRYIFRQSLRKRRVTLSAPLVLSWLYYGKSFEAMVDMVSRQAGHPKAGNAERMGCSIVVRQIIEVSIKNGFRTQEDWDRHLAMKSAIEKGGIGEWALQSVKDKIGGNDTENNQTETTSSVTGTAPQTQRKAGKKKIQERPLADYLKCGNKEAVIQCIRNFVSINTSAVHQALPFYVLKDLRLVAGMHAAKEYSVGMALQFPDLPSLKSESAIRQAVGFLKAAKHVIKDGKDQMAPLIESDENRDLYRTLAAESEKSLPMMKRKLWPDRAKRAVLHGHADLNCHDNLRQIIIYQSVSIRIYFCTVNPLPGDRRCFSFTSHRKRGIRELLKMVITKFKTAPRARSCTKPSTICTSVPSENRRPGRKN